MVYKKESKSSFVLVYTGTKVLKRVASIPGNRSSCTIDIGALFFQLQFPDEVGVPILYSTIAGASDSSTQFSYAKGGYSRWPLMVERDKNLTTACDLVNPNKHNAFSALYKLRNQASKLVCWLTLLLNQSNTCTGLAVWQRQAIWQQDSTPFQSFE